VKLKSVSAQTLPDDRLVRRVALGLLIASACFSVLGIRAAVVTVLPWLFAGS
jgi:hypothetical protein